MNENLHTEATNQTPAEIVKTLIDLMAIEQIDGDIYRGPITNEPWMRVFGGQVVSQALMAACHTVDDDRLPHSLHAYFVRPGDPKLPIIYDVSRDRDGKSFSSRRVVAKQGGIPILNLSCSFQTGEDGLHHQFAMPNVVGPENLKSETQLVLDVLNGPPSYSQQSAMANRQHLLRPRPIEFRPINQDRYLSLKKGEPAHCFWFNAIAPLPRDQNLHRVLLAYASDMMLLSTALLPHGVSWHQQKMQVASLDHALWLHEDFWLDEWLLYALEAPWSGGARGMNRGLVYTQSGKLVASVAQEGLIRQHPEG